ncbi:MAG: hypothetical protein IJA09_02685 [Bacteroidales bacterium]|nr:hypothetical protein [Bacteroidales bacterium]
MVEENNIEEIEEVEKSNPEEINISTKEEINKEENSNISDGEEPITEKKRIGLLKGIWTLIRIFFNGKILSIDFIIKHWITISTIIFVVLFYISNRYINQINAAEIKKTERKITEARYRALEMSSRLKKIQCSDSIIKYIDKYNLELEFPTQPPYIIDEDGKK